MKWKLNLQKTIVEKDSKIDDLENKFKELNIDELQRKVKEQERCSKKQQKNFEFLILKMTKLETNLLTPEKLRIKCSECDFSSVSEQGLKTHIKRKHYKSNKKEEVVVFPKICDLCDYEMENNKELKQHMVTHSYKRVDFQCEECDFGGKNPYTMEVHTGKKHCENFECGLCQYVAKDLETLDTHLFTCEVFECCSCNVRFKNLVEMKTHMIEEHEDDPAGKLIKHRKLNRKNSEVVDSSSHFSEELFPELL